MPERKALSIDEARRIFERMAEVAASKDVILIGGQAVALWAAQLSGSASELDTEAVSSADVDFQGSKASLVRAAELLGGKAQFPSLDHVASPMIGKAVFLDSDSVKRELDFLPNPRGLDADDVAKSAIPLDITGSGEASFRVWVMHPQRCLESRVANSDLPNKDTALAWRQLRASIICARAFSKALLDEAEPQDEAEVTRARRTVLNLNQRIYRFALNDQRARRIAADRGIEVFDAVLRDERLGDQFLSRGYPQMAVAIDKRRKRDAKASE
jgi:hypothetical protein